MQEKKRNSKTIKASANIMLWKEVSTFHHLKRRGLNKPIGLPHPSFCHSNQKTFIYKGKLINQLTSEWELFFLLFYFEFSSLLSNEEAWRFPCWGII